MENLKQELSAAIKRRNDARKAADDASAALKRCQIMCEELGQHGHRASDLTAEIGRHVAAQIAAGGTHEPPGDLVEARDDARAAALKLEGVVEARQHLDLEAARKQNELKTAEHEAGLAAVEIRRVEAEALVDEIETLRLEVFAKENRILAIANIHLFAPDGRPEPIRLGEKVARTLYDLSHAERPLSLHETREMVQARNVDAQNEFKQLCEEGTSA